MVGDDVPEPFNPPLGPGGDTTPGLTPPSPSGGGLGNPYNGFSPPSITDDGSGNPDTSSGFRPNLTPSSAPDSRRLSLYVVLASCGAIVLKLYWIDSYSIYNHCLEYDEYISG